MVHEDKWLHWSNVDPPTARSTSKLLPNGAQESALNPRRTRRSPRGPNDEPSSLVTLLTTPPPKASPNSDPATCVQSPRPMQADDMANALPTTGREAVRDRWGRRHRITDRGTVRSGAKRPNEALRRPGAHNGDRGERLDPLLLWHRDAVSESANSCQGRARNGAVLTAIACCATKTNDQWSAESLTVRMTTPRRPVPSRHTEKRRPPKEGKASTVQVL